MGKKNRSQATNSLRGSRGKSRPEREHYWKKSEGAPDLGNTSPMSEDGESAETEKQISSPPGISAGGEGRHRIDLPLTSQSLWDKYGKPIGIIGTLCSALAAIGTMVHYSGKYSSDLAHNQQSLDKMEKSSEEHREFLVRIDKRLSSVEDKMRVLEKIDDSSSLMAKDLIALKTVVEDLRAGKDTNIDKFQAWTEQQLAKLERRVDSLWETKSSSN